MKLVELQSTDQLVRSARDGVEPVGRVWIGRTEDGIPVQLLVRSVAVSNKHDQSAFERELNKTHAPIPASQAFPLRMLL